MFEPHVAQAKHSSARKRNMVMRIVHAKLIPDDKMRSNIMLMNTKLTWIGTSFLGKTHGKTVPPTDDPLTTMPRASALFLLKYVATALFAP